MTPFHPLRENPQKAPYGPSDALVIFGECFSRGYVNGLIDEALRRGMKIIYSTVGRREKDGRLRALNAQELSEKGHGPIINIPLEAGFDVEPDGQGVSPIDPLAEVKLSEWDSVKLNFDSIEESRSKGEKRFLKSVTSWVAELEKLLPEGNIVFAHTMAGGIPRTKIVMPLMNRIFKGFGERYASSEEFWATDIGRLCAISFLEVTGETFRHLVEATDSLRERRALSGHRVSYLAYGYHGTEVFKKSKTGGSYHWQSYAPYLQGWAKLRLEEIATQFFKSGAQTAVFNAPEILTNSSSVFLGVEVCLYALLGALRFEDPQHPLTTETWKKASTLLKIEHSVEEILDFIAAYLESDVIRQWTQFQIWPQHNGPDQMRKLRESSQHIMDMHLNHKELMTSPLSEIVFRSLGRIMLDQSWNLDRPVWWVGQDAVARSATGTQ